MLRHNAPAADDDRRTDGRTTTVS